MSALLADRYQANLEVLAGRTSAALLRAWAYASPWDFAGEGRFHQVAKPIAIGAATAAVNASTAYATATDPELATGTPSPLIVADAGARMFTPFETLSSRLAAGDRWTAAVDAARDVVDALGSDVVLSPARQAVADVLPAVSPWVRRLNSGACPWCLNLSGVEWPTASSATFGHSRCQCVAVPAFDAGDHNDRLRAVAGFDQQAKNLYRIRDQRARLRDSESLARSRQAQAKADQLTEVDPARRERLSIREQEWETRAEHAAERLRLLETGTHRLAA
jgi:hypothetical protein